MTNLEGNALKRGVNCTSLLMSITFHLAQKKLDPLEALNQMSNCDEKNQKHRNTLVLTMLLLIDIQYLHQSL